MARMLGDDVYRIPTTSSAPFVVARVRVVSFPDAQIPGPSAAKKT